MTFHVDMRSYLGAQPIAEGARLPSPIRYTDGPVTVELEVHDERVVVTKVSVEVPAKDGGVRTETIRELALTPIRSWAVAYLALSETGPGEMSPAVDHLSDEQVRHVMRRASLNTRRRVLSADALRGAVHSWEHGGIDAVVEDHQVSRRTAYRWIDRARTLGLIAEES